MHFWHIWSTATTVIAPRAVRLMPTLAPSLRCSAGAIGSAGAMATAELAHRLALERQALALREQLVDGHRLFAKKKHSSQTRPLSASVSASLLPAHVAVMVSHSQQLASSGTSSEASLRRAVKARQAARKAEHHRQIEERTSANPLTWEGPLRGPLDGETSLDGYGFPMNTIPQQAPKSRQRTVRNILTNTGFPEGEGYVPADAFGKAMGRLTYQHKKWLQRPGCDAPESACDADLHPGFEGTAQQPAPVGDMASLELSTPLSLPQGREVSKKRWPSSSQATLRQRELEYSLFKENEARRYAERKLAAARLSEQHPWRETSEPQARHKSRTFTSAPTIHSFMDLHMDIGCRHIRQMSRSKSTCKPL
eukprot:6214447-Pleurochrysis_carterae.AAC.2